MKFWDASALVPLCVDQAQAPLFKRMVGEDAAMVVWWVTLVEVYSALARRRREGIISGSAEDQGRRVVGRLAVEWTEIEPGSEVREAAARVLLFHPLRAADALQLAAALVWANGRPTGHGFVCLDQRLREAASREGFQVLPEQG